MTIQLHGEVWADEVQVWVPLYTVACDYCDNRIDTESLQEAGFAGFTRWLEGCNLDVCRQCRERMTSEDWA